MIAALLAAAPVLAAAPAPSPSPAQSVPDSAVTPGIVGFLATFAVVLAAIGLFQLMTRSLRRTTHNAQTQGMEISEPARVGRGITLPVRPPEPTVPGVLDGGTPFGDAAAPSGPKPPLPTPVADGARDGGGDADV